MTLATSRALPKFESYGMLETVAVHGWKADQAIARYGDREACAIDLRHDPNALIWEAYCPNSDVLNVLVALTEASVSAS